MKKLYLVLIYEFRRIVFRPSFIILLLMLPLFTVGYSIVMEVTVGKQDTQMQFVQQILNPPEKTVKEGYVDLSGIIQMVPENWNNKMVIYSDEHRAQAALKSGEIDALYIIPRDYLKLGKIIYHRNDLKLSEIPESSQSIQFLLVFNLLNGDQRLADKFVSPYTLSEEILSTSKKIDINDFGQMMAPMAMWFILFFSISGGASLLLTSVSKERENRTLEILLNSISTRDLMVGKLIALGSIGLMQEVVWLGGSYALYQLTGMGSGMINNLFIIPGGILLWGMAFFILGYLLYGILMAGVGILSPANRDNSTISFLVLAPLFFSFLLLNTLITRPNQYLSIFVSIFPFTSPVSMMMRMMVTEVPLWQIMLAVFFLMLTVVIVMWLVSKILRAHIVLIGQPFNIKKWFMLILPKFSP